MLIPSTAFVQRPRRNGLRVGRALNSTTRSLVAISRSSLVSRCPCVKAGTGPGSSVGDAPKSRKGLFRSDHNLTSFLFSETTRSRALRFRVCSPESLSHGCCCTKGSDAWFCIPLKDQPRQSPPCGDVRRAPSGLLCFEGIKGFCAREGSRRRTCTDVTAVAEG